VPRVILGNPWPIFNGIIQRDDNALTMVHVPETKTLQEAIRDIAHDDGTPHVGGAGSHGAWKAHSGASKPSFVSCPDWPELEEALAKHFGCPTGAEFAAESGE
jgi:hypothetical protein